MTCGLFLNAISGQNRDSATVLCRHGYSFVINHSKTSWSSYPRPIIILEAQFGSVTFAQGHFRSYKVTTSYRNEIERSGGFHWVSTRQDTLFYLQMAFFGQYLTLRPRNLIWGQNLAIWPFRVKRCKLFCVSARETQWHLNYCSNILCSSFFSRETILLSEVVDQTSENSWLFDPAPPQPPPYIDPPLQMSGEVANGWGLSSALM